VDPRYDDDVLAVLSFRLLANFFEPSKLQQNAVIRFRQENQSFKETETNWLIETNLHDSGNGRDMNWTKKNLLST
jgi:hypothetical protein